MTDVLSESYAIHAELVEMRRDVHRHPECGLHLPLTAQYVFDKLQSFGLDPQRIGDSGVYCTIGTGNKTVLMRAETDALPMQELSGLPFAATNGSCHACGHDMHTAMMLGAAKLLKQHEGDLSGTAKILFQPGEEVLAGAKEMIDAGIMENPHVTHALTIHVDPEKATGSLGFAEGFVTASVDCLRITVQGKAAHGSKPSLGVDAIFIAAPIVQALDHLPVTECTKDEPAVVLVGTIHGGTAPNSVADCVVLEVTVRAESSEVRTRLLTRIQEVSETLARSMKGAASFEIVYGAPPVYNDPAFTQEACAIAKELFGEDRLFVHERQSVSDDFAWFSEQVPSAHLKLGAGGANVDSETFIPLHNSHVLLDENTLPIGTAFLAAAALHLLR